MARKFSAFTNNPSRVPLDTLVGLDISAAAAAQNSYWSLNTLFSEITGNVTDGAIRFGGFAAPAVSAAGKGAIYFDSTSNTFKVSQNTGAYFNVGNITTTGFTATRIPIANAANTLIDDAGLTFNTSTNILTVGETTGGGVGLVGSNGNSNVLASQAPAATLLTYWPNAAPTAGQFLYAATVGAQVQLGYQTAPSGSGSANQIAVWGASNALSGSSALTFASGVVSITGTTNPGVVITGSAATESGITVNQSVSGAAADAFHSFQTPSSTVVWRLTTAGFTPTGLIKANQLDMFGATGTVEMLFRLADASTRFVYGVNNGEAASINATSTLNLVLGADSGAAVPLTGRVRMYNSAGTTYSQISAGNAGSSLNFIWPVVNPTAGQVLSASAPSGSDVTLSWASAAGGSSLTATQVGFGDGSNLLSGSADFTYTTATGVLDITKTGVNSSVRMTVTNASAGTAAQARFGAAADVSGSSLIAYSSTFTTSGLRTANSAVLDLDGTTSVFLGQSTGSFRWGLGTTEYAQMTTTAFTLYGPTTGSVTGLSVTSAAAGSGVTLTALSSGSNENLILTPKGSGYIKTTGDVVYGTKSSSVGRFSVETTYTVLNTHSFDDYSTLTPAAGGSGFSSFDASTTMGGAVNNDHYIGYQSRLTYTSSGNITGIYGMSGLYIYNQHTGAGTIPDAHGIYIRSVGSGGGPITNAYGIRVLPVTQGATANYAISTEGGLNAFTGPVLAGHTSTPVAQVDIRNSSRDVSLYIANSRATGTNYGLSTQATGAGTVNYASYFNATGATTNWAIYADNGLSYFKDSIIIGSGTLGFGLVSAPDLILRRVSAASLSFGAADAASPVAQTISVQNVVAGTSNTAGVNWTRIASRGTGTGAGGNHIWQVAPAAGSSSTQNTLINGLVLTSTGQLYGAALHNNSAAVTGTTNQYIASGTYTPTVTAVVNCTATSSGICNWIRVGNVVTVSGVVAVDPTSATTFTSVGISLPIASNFATNASECAGVAANANVQGYSGAITADFTNDRAQLDFTTGVDVANQGWSFTFTYVVL